MNYIFFQMTAINGFDEISHYLRASLLVNVCSTYVTQGEAPGCGAHFTQTKGVAASSTSNPTAALANGGNAPKDATSASTKSSPVQTLAALAKGLLNLGKRSPGDAHLQAQGRAGIKRLQQAAAKDSSPALDNAGGGNASQEALLSYLMGNG
jgi:hypothetical protein